MRRLLIAAATLAGAFVLEATPAFADTLQEVTTHGMILMLGDMQIEVTYTPDGKFTAADGQVTGTWKIDGDKLCTTSNFDPNESCVVYPKGKTDLPAPIPAMPQRTGHGDRGSRRDRDDNRGNRDDRSRGPRGFNRR